MRSSLLISHAGFLALTAAQGNPDYPHLSWYGHPTTCVEPRIFNLSSIDALLDCTVVGEYSPLGGLPINASITDPINIPHVQTVNGSIIFFVRRLGENIYPNTTSLSMPDLETVTGSIDLYQMHRLTTLELPKLKSIGQSIMWNSDNGPSLNITLPSLEKIDGPVFITGNIDVISLPAIKQIGAIKVNSTGELDCSSLSKALDQCTITIGHDSLECIGKNDAHIGNYVDATPTGEAGPASTTPVSTRVCSSGPGPSVAGLSATVTSTSAMASKTQNGAARKGVAGVGLAAAVLGAVLL